MLRSAESIMRLIMPDEAYNQKVAEFQSEFLRRLAHHEPPQVYMVPSLLQRVLECDEELLEFSLGKIGQKLKLFAQGVDFSHPELPHIFDGVLADDQNFAQECLELITLAYFARDKNLNRIVPLLGRTIAKEGLARNILKRIDVPQNNRMHVRLLKNKEDRDGIRMTKRMQIIDLTSVYKKGDDVWNAQPDNFKKFLRFDTAYQDELKIAERKVERYKELGCDSLAAEVQKSIETFREHMEQSYYGFNRITMTSAAVILAKSLGFNYSAPQEMLSGNYLIGTNEGKISVPRKFFGKYNFDPEQTLEFSPYVTMMAGSPVYTQRQLGPFQYEPRVYPLHEFLGIAPEGVQKIISLLEAFPDANDKPIFDHFGVIVPGVAFPLPGKALTYTFLDERGMVQSHTIREEALKALDTILINGEYITPVLVGEKDGKCYFISFWR